MSFDELYAQYEQLVLGIISRSLAARGASTDTTQDIAQQVWMEAWEHLTAGGHVTQAWLSLRAQSRASNHLRSLSCRREDSLDAIVEQEDSDAEVDIFSDDSIDRWRDPYVRDRLAELIEQLPPQPRRAVELRFFGGLPVADVAREMGITPNTASKHIGRGVSALRDMLTGAHRQEAA